DLGVEQAQRIANAMAQIDAIRQARERIVRAEARVERAQAADSSLQGQDATFRGLGGVNVGAEPMLRALREGLNAPGTALYAAAVIFEEASKRFILDPQRVPPGGGPPQVTQALEQATNALGGATRETSSAVADATSELAAANAALEALLAGINAPANS